MVCTASHSSDSSRVTPRNPNVIYKLSGLQGWKSELVEPESLITGNKDGCLCSRGKHTSSKPIQEQVLSSIKRSYVCVPRLFALKMIVFDKEQSVPTSEDMKEYERLMENVLPEGIISN